MPNNFTVPTPGFSNPMQLTAVSEFYLGFATSILGPNDSFPILPSDRDVFGWVQVQVVDFGDFNGDPPGDPTGDPADFFLGIVDSAIAYESAGIIVGTATAISVPEPSTMAPLALITGFFLRRRKRL